MKKTNSNIKITDNWIIVGILWGDEGKGKIIDMLSEQFDTIVRSQGGDNAGHTILVNDKKHKFRLLPSGVLHKDKNIVIGSGVALNLETLLAELKTLASENLNFHLYISQTAHIVLDYHIQMDILVEEIKANKKIGTTKRGIGPCYEDRVNRFGIRVDDLFDYENLLAKISLALKFKNKIFEAFSYKQFNAKILADKYFNLGQKIQKYVINTGIFLEEKLNNKKQVLFEGAQGVMLCVENGTYPYVTSSSPTASVVANINGIRWDHKYNILGVAKAYISRVGEGPFVTELFSEESNYIREKGNEYGTVTKRPRRVGWLDLVLLKHSIRVSSVNYIALTLLDVLSGLTKLKICTHYEINGKKTDVFPVSQKELINAKPIYHELAGWSEDITSITSYEHLPMACKKYVEFIEANLKLKVIMISNGPSRENIIIKK